MDEPRNSPICNTIDRISNLPEALIHYIMSFMDMTHVVRTCVLSKRWKLLWTCTPVLNFDFNIFSLAFPHNQNNGVIPAYQKFIKFVDQVFILRDGSDIQRLNLVCGKERNYFDIAASLTTWLVVAVRRNVRELCLDISAVKVSRFPQCVFTCTSLSNLELKLGAGNSSVMVLPTSMDLPRLTFMKLDSLPSTDVNSTNRLFERCPVLESLIIEGHLGHMDLQISSLTLKHLKIVDSVNKTSSKVKIDAPNLVSFECKDYTSKWYVIENLASLVAADICMTYTKYEAGREKDYIKRHRLFLTALSNAKELRILSELFLVISLWPVRSIDILYCQFSNLRVVQMKSCLSKAGMRALGWLLQLSPNVESLSIIITGMPESDKPDNEFTDQKKKKKKDKPDNEDHWKKLSGKIKLDHLRSVEIRDVLGYYNELKFVEIMFKSSVILEKMLLFSSKKCTSDKRLITFGEKLLKLPRASSNVTTFLV